jgi:DNA-binding phage protein
MERAQTVSMYPIMVSGALGSDNAMKDYLKAKRDEYRRSVLAKASAFVKRQRAKMSQVGTSTKE